MYKKRGTVLIIPIWKNISTRIRVQNTNELMQIIKYYQEGFVHKTYTPKSEEVERPWILQVL